MWIQCGNRPWWEIWAKTSGRSEPRLFRLIVNIGRCVHRWVVLIDVRCIGVDDDGGHLLQNAKWVSLSKSNKLKTLPFIDLSPYLTWTGSGFDRSYCLYLLGSVGLVRLSLSNVTELIFWTGVVFLASGQSLSLVNRKTNPMFILHVTNGHNQLSVGPFLVKMCSISPLIHRGKTLFDLANLQYVMN